MSQLSVRPASKADTPAMVALSAHKRRLGAQVQPLFWKPAPDADARQASWFEHLLDQGKAVLRVAEAQDGILGFAIGMLHPAPPVYQPGGPTCTIDDFCARTDATWPLVGAPLLASVARAAKELGAVQVVVVCGVHEVEKLEALRGAGLEAMSLWSTCPIERLT